MIRKKQNDTINNYSNFLFDLYAWANLLPTLREYDKNIEVGYVIFSHNLSRHFPGIV